MAPTYSVVSEAAACAKGAEEACPDEVRHGGGQGICANAPRADGLRVGAAALLAVCLLGGAAYAAELRRGARTGTAPAPGDAAAEGPGGQRLRAAGVAKLWQAGHRHLEDLTCGPFDIESDWDFTNTDVLQTVSGIKTAQDCQDECSNADECGAWSWGRMKSVDGLSKTCFLKRLVPGAIAQKFRRFGVTSGIMAGVPCEEAIPEADRQTKILGVVKVREGICLAAENPSKPGSEVQMLSCVVDSSNQVWMYDETVGQVKNQAGLCLGASHWSQDFASVGMHQCDAGNWSQQWTFDSVSGILKIWRGNCLESGEPGVDGGVLFMHACDIENSNQQWDIGDPNEIITDDTISSVQHYMPGTLFCFALMMPHSYEQELLEDQESRGTGLFDCDDWMIYSNKPIQIGPKTASVIDSDLKCKMGGEFGTALNLDIFIVLWDKLVEDALYLEHNWTAKVDPDAVFFALRLRMILTTHTEGESGSYLNNCKYGLHGPLEVFSRKAVTAWSEGWRDCKKTFEEKCGGDCFWGEDLFIDQCLDKVLKVKRDNDFRLLLEDHCEPPPNWDDCTDEIAVAFHPFKNVSSWNKCLAAGLGDGALPPPKAAAVSTGGDGEGSGEADDLADAEDALNDAVSSMTGDNRASSGKQCPEGCHTAEPGEACYKAVQWARSVGIVDHPEWYPTLRVDSTWEEFQGLLQQSSSEEVDCKPPCGPCEESSDDAGAEDSDGMEHAYEDSARKGDVESLSN